MAWLNATPKPPPETKRAKTGRGSSISRIDRMKRDRITPPMPPNPLPHIVAHWIEIGLTESNGMGATPLSWREINEWQQATGIPLSAWEARMIHNLSVSYLAEGRRAESETCPAPWSAGIVTPREREVELEQLRSVLG